MATIKVTVEPLSGGGSNTRNGSMGILAVGEMFSKDRVEIVMNGYTGSGKSYRPLPTADVKVYHGSTTPVFIGTLEEFLNKLK